MAQEEHGRLSLLEFNYSTIGVHVSMVSTWRDRQCRLGLALAMLVKLAQTCVGAVRFFIAPVVHVCCNNKASDSERTNHHDRRNGRRSPGICARHTGCTFYFVIVAAPVKIVSSRKVAHAVEKKNDPH